MSTWLMVLSALCMVIGLFLHRDNKVNWGKPLALAGTLGVIVFAVIRILPSGGNIAAREFSYRSASITVLGELLADTMPGARALVILRPETEQPTTQSEEELSILEKALTKGGIDVVAVETPSIPEDHLKQVQETRPESVDLIPLATWYTAEVFDRMMEGNEDVDLIISLTGLPVDPYEVAAMKVWKRPKSERPVFALTDSPFYDMKNLIADGTVVACVAPHPEPVYVERVPGDAAKAFDQRFLMLTAENVDAIDLKYKEEEYFRPASLQIQIPSL